MKTLLAFLIVALPLAGAEPAQPLNWKAGAASVVITPEVDMPMAGYASRDKPSEEKAQDLFAKALALEAKSLDPLRALLALAPQARSAAPKAYFATSPRISNAPAYQ